MTKSNWVERRRLLVYPALMSLGVGVLSSCAATPPPAPQQTVAIEPPPPPPPPPPRRRVFPLPAHKPAPPSEAEGEAGAAEPAPNALALANAEPAPPALSANALIGLDQTTAKRLLGAATEQSEAPPATVWRYRNATCELDLFFYLDLRSGKMRTLHYAFKGEPADAAAKQDCLHSFVVARGN